MERLSYELISEVGKLPNVEASALAHTGPKWLAPFFALTVIPAALAAARQVDVVHLGDPVLSLTGWVIKKNTGKPVAVTVHGLDITFSNWLYQLYLRLFFKGFDLYLPISDYVGKLLEERIKNHESRIKVVNPGIHYRFYDPSTSRTDLERLLETRSYQLKTDDKVIMTSGRLIKRKGHAWFIEHVLTKLPEHVVYIIAGEGPEREIIEQAATSTSPPFPPSKQVFMLGRVSENDLKVLYNTVDAFVQPNIPVEGDVEGFGLVLLEAALCNRPVIVSRLEGMTDAIQHGKNGLIVEAKNVSAWIQAIQTTLNSPPKTSSTRSYTQQEFSWSKHAQAFADALTIVAT